MRAKGTPGAFGTEGYTQRGISLVLFAFILMGSKHG
jgi:hypothetical protein